MTNWFQAKIKYLTTSPEDGSVKQKKEIYLFDAVGFADAELRLTKILSEQIPEFNILSCAKLNIEDVIIDEAHDNYFKVKVRYTSADPDSGKEKKINESYIVQADDLKEACKKMEDRLQGSIVSWEIPSITKTNVVDVFPYIEETVIEK
jgi:hypothetical protein